MLTGKKILITGPAGQIAFPLARSLVERNDVWGIARFTDEATLAQVEKAGIRPKVVDLASGDFGDLPRDFDYVLHMATYRSSDRDYDEALRVNAEGTHLLLEHCRDAQAALVMSTVEVYRPHLNPWHVLVETDPLGDTFSKLDPTYSVSKIAQEAVARSCARAFGLPVVIPRMNASYGPAGGLLAYHLHYLLAGHPIVVRWDPAVYTPIHQDDINDHVESLLNAATTPATVINWGGDETVTVMQWTEYMQELTGVAAKVVVQEVPNGIRGIVADNSRRLAVTGPCQVTWRDGVRRLVEQAQGDNRAGDGLAQRASRLLAATASQPDSA